MGFIGKRLTVTILTLFLVSAVTFSAFRLVPGDAALVSLGMEASQEQIEKARAEMGLTGSYPARYLSWLKNFFTGNLGYSSRFRGEEISGIILERLPVTAALAAMSLCFIILIAIPVSLLSVRREYSVTDRIVKTFTALNISMPSFFTGILFIWIFALVFKWFSPGSYVPYREDGAAFFAYLIFPALAIALPNAALVVKFLRASLFRELKSDYVRTARSKGAGFSRILKRHVLKNASLPVITLLGMITAEIFSGSIVIEQVFGIPGIGRLLLASISARDFPMTETLLVYIAFAVILANSLADIALQMADPRIRLSSKA